MELLTIRAKIKLGFILLPNDQEYFSGG